MRYGRRRNPDPAEEAAEADSWLADYRASSEDSGDEFPPSHRRHEADDSFAGTDDPFAGNGNGGEPPAVPAPLLSEPPPGPFMRGGPPPHGGRVTPNYDEPTGSFGARQDYDEPTGSFRAPPPRGEPTGSFGARAAPPAYDEPTGGFGAPPAGPFGGPPSRDEPTGTFGAPPGGPFGAPPRDEPSGSFGAPPAGAFGRPLHDEPTGGFGAPAAGAFNSPPPRAEPTGGFGAPPAGSYGGPSPRDEPTGTFGAPSAGTFGGQQRDEPTGTFGAPSAGTFGGQQRDEPTGSFGGRAVTPSYDEPTGSFGAAASREEAGSPFESGSAAGTPVPRRPPATSPHADEEPIFKRFDPSAPPVVPATPPQEEPILKYMAPRDRTGTRSTYGGRRRAPDQRPSAVSGPPATASAAPAPVTPPPGTAGGRRRRYRDDEETTTSAGPAPGFAPEYQEPYPAQPAGFAEPPSRPGFAEPPSRPGFAEPPSRPSFAEPPSRPSFAEPPSRAGGPPELPGRPGYLAEPDARAGYPEPAYPDPAGYADPPLRPARRELPSQPTYVEPAAYAESPGYGGNQGYAEAPPYAEQYGDQHQDYRRDADYPNPRYGDTSPYPGDDRDYPAAAAYGAPTRQPELPAGPSRARREDEPQRPPSLPPAETMRTVSPDTTGDMPRISSTTSGSIPRITTTGSVPRVGSGTSGSTGRVAAVGSTTTGSLPRIGPSTTGSLRPVRIDPVRPASRRPSKAMLALAVVGVLVLIAVCGASTWFVFQDELSGKDNNKGGQANTPAPLRDITSRDADPEPLTEAEVFPREQIAGTTGNQYQILKKEAKTDCTQAATDDLAKLLVDNGCSQVVRGTMKSSDGVYLITAGIFNLKDEPAAIKTHESIEPTVKAQKGRFTGLLAGADTEVLVRAPMVLGWHARGHYLAYCVIARADGQGFDESSQAARDQIQADILTTHLRDTIIGGRTQPNRGGPAGSAPAASPSQS